MKRLALVGFMGSGKTTIGRLLAKSLSMPFMDLDEEIIRITNRTIPQIFAEEGEDGFRTYEYQALYTMALLPEESVLSTGGGLITQPSAREILTHHFYIIYLDISFEAALLRIQKDGSTRPLAQNSPDALSQLKKRYDDRKPVYESVANFRCEAMGAVPEEIVEKITSHLQMVKW